MYEAVIIGGGPAGVAAGVYAARKKMRAALVADAFGGQSVVSSAIHNWIGETNISGFDLARKLEAHARYYKDDLDIVMARAETIEKTDAGFRVHSAGRPPLETKTVLVASGSSRKKLGVPGEDRLNGKGVAYCSICDAPLFGGQTVAVVGGGNAGLEAVLDLVPYAETIYVFQRSGALRGDPVTQEKIAALPQVRIMYNTVVREIAGDQFVTGVRVADAASGAARDIPLRGIFIEIGAVPNSGLVGDLCALDAAGRIVIDHKTGMSSLPGIWAAGDVADGLYQQNNIASGDAIRAILNIHQYLRA
jgi:alkyl hydroperoxide reductase subunit F